MSAPSRSATPPRLGISVPGRLRQPCRAGRHRRSWRRGAYPAGRRAGRRCAVLAIGPRDRPAATSLRARADRPRGEKFFREIRVQASGDFRQLCLLCLATNERAADGAERFVQEQPGGRVRSRALVGASDWRGVWPWPFAQGNRQVTEITRLSKLSDSPLEPIVVFLDERLLHFFLGGLAYRFLSRPPSVANIARMV